MLISGLREPVYREITEDAPMVVPQRRPMVRSLKDRITNIVSMYVPNGSSHESPLFASKNSQLKHDLVDDNDVAHINDHFGLLSLGELENQVESGKSGLCHIVPFIDKGTLVTSILNELQNSAYTISPSDFVISCMATDSIYLYFGVQSLPFLFKFEIALLNTSLERPYPVTKIHLKTAESVDLIPSKVCLKSCRNETSEFYVIGTAQLEASLIHILACYSIDGRLIAQTRKYLYQRYLAIDVDTDGNILLGCTSRSIDDDANHPSNAQICKLTPHFERRIFSVTLRKGSTSYCPDWITRSCVQGQCWASVSRWDSETKRMVRRIVAFPGVQPECESEGEVVRSPKEWLHVTSWSFEVFSAGSVFALDSQRLLTIDAEQRSLAMITWTEGQKGVSLQRLTKPGARKIDHFCVSNTYPPVAYLASEGDIFTFIPTGEDTTVSIVSA
ncbi:unnamed protein product [Hydatigera taeniaeformis]|uniref:DUF5736 domain-containing protein n=1 Tax=Hydatigena taeniaeformis TaxID=6205 RepID=A0A0R3WN58_HYDTA|nr:unnamed protein product [Hydatigera taeniaeformis]